MTDVEERPGRQLATNLRELMKQVDIRTGTERDVHESERDRDNESVASASVRDIFARARTNLPTPSSRIMRPRGLSIDSDVLSTNDGDDASTVDSTPIARVPPGAASLNALRQRLETASDATSDLTGWDRSARSLLTTRGQASQSRLNIYDDGSNLMDEDLAQVPALTVSHVDFAPSVSSTSHSTVGATPRQRPPVIPRGPSLQSASIAERLASITDDALEFDDTDREYFDRNRMDDDSEDLLHRENDLLRSSSPPPPDSPMKPPTRPISGSWENVLAEGSVMSLPNVEGRKPARKPELGSSGGSGSGSGSGSKLLQAIQDEEDSYQRSVQEKSGSTATVGNETQRPPVSPDKTNRPTSRLSITGRSRLPLAKPSPSTGPNPSPSTSKSPSKLPTHKNSRSDVAFPSSTQDIPDPPAGRISSPPKSRIPRPSSPGPRSPASPRTSTVPPVTPSRIPRASMSFSPRSSVGSSPSHMVRSTPAVTPSRTRAVSALGSNPRAAATTPSRTRATSAMAANGVPPETDVDRERAWGKQLPKLTHANLRMRHDQMDTVHSYLSGMSPERNSNGGRSRPTTPSFAGYTRKGTSEVSSSNGSAGSDEDTEQRRRRKLSIANPQDAKPGWDIHGSPSASVTRSPGLARTSSLKTPSKPSSASMRHSLSFTGSPSAAGSEHGVSPVNSPRKLSSRNSAEFISPKEYKVLRERDWGRPINSRAFGLANIRTRGTPAPGGRNRVASGGSVGESDVSMTSPVRERNGGAKPRPHTVHLGGSYTSGGGPSLDQLGREPLGRAFEDDEMSESVLEWQRRQQSIEDLQEETEVEELTRPESPSPPSPSRSIPLPDSPPLLSRPLQRGTTPPAPKRGSTPQTRSGSVPKVQLHPPEEASTSLFGDGMVGESTTVESSRERRDSLRESSRKERETTVRNERRNPVHDEPSSDDQSHPGSPKHLTFAQPESPTISFMDTLPPLPEPPSDDEHSVVIPPVRPSVNTRVSRIAREPSPGSGGSGSEKTPRASTMSLRVPSPGAPEPEPTKDLPGTSILGLQPTPAQSDTLEIPRPVRTRSRSNTLGTSLPRVEVDVSVPRDEIDSAATPIATRWNPPAREKKPVEIKPPRKPSPLASQVSSPAIPSSISLPSTPAPPLQARHSDPQLPPMMSQKGREILQRMQQQAAMLAKDLETESQQSVPQGDEGKAETEQIVHLSTAARAERGRLEQLRKARGPKEKITVVQVPVKRRSISWIFSIILSALCVWLALYALSHHATNVYLDPLYPVLYGGDANPLRAARTIDTFPTSWQSYMVPKSGVQQWLTPISQKLWALPTNWRPS
ncbi:GA28568 gene product from transcript GA28568-RA [Rhizoctonia solani AG-1 IB]|uniref:GA28568 gene product from transcript GA28568-RA n=1 Tax=Thanatephorus cucumeris (strain AG1-IB / isolate 7/3/14) TaxID=1108050 RepID=A0A0B7FLZ5_THACB|nr:GA28568 gene product from transcript GA28568-RA [Rhizoctonia solani AG-1 IB]